MIRRCLLVTVLCIGLGAYGQDATPSTGSKKDPKAEEYEKTVKDLPKTEGAFTFYIRKKDILLELPESKVGVLFLFQATLHSGAGEGAQAGDPINMTSIDAFRFDRDDDQLILVEPNLKTRGDAADPLSRANERSAPEAFLGNYKIEQTHPEKKLLLVNVTGLFQGDVIRLTDTLNAGVPGQFSLDREKSRIDRVKSFPENAVVRMLLHYQGSGTSPSAGILELLGLAPKNTLADSRSLPVRVTYNLWYRQDTGYRPRAADPRVGYFTEDFVDLAKFWDDDRTTRWITRFDLRKKDPNAAMSEPVKPIVWTLDNSIPERYRPAFRRGVLFWNKAFEKLGFKNAIQVQDQPNDPDYDHADGRYNVIRLTMTPGSGYAVAQARNDPFTGQILNAAITFDANMVRAAWQEYRDIVTPGANALQAAMDLFVRRPGVEGQAALRALWDPSEGLRQRRNSVFAPAGWQVDGCRYAEGKAESAAYAWDALMAAPNVGISRNDYIDQYIADTVCHEVGHCLGLRHNFSASTHLTTAELANDAIVGREGISASVMDYTPVNFQSVLKGRGWFYAPGVGPYDVHAIEYGYCDAGFDERMTLAQIASRINQPGLAYMTDEDADGVDPTAVRFDCAKDSIRYSLKMLAAGARMRTWAIANLPTRGESYAKRNALILRSFTRLFREGAAIARWVGGIQGNRNFRGDTNEKPTLRPVEAGLQREALNVIARECLSLKAMPLPESVLLTMSGDYSTGQGSGYTAPLRELITAPQQMLAATLLSAVKLETIVENEIKTPRGRDRYTLAEHFGAVLGAVFEEVGKPGSIAGTRRDLQRFVVNGLITQASAPSGGVPEDVRLLATDHLRRLSARLKPGKGADPLTVAHLRDLKATIDRFLARRVTVAR